MLDIIWGVKTKAIFDVWTIEHFFSGVSVGTGVILHNNKHLGGLIKALKEGIFPKKRYIGLNIDTTYFFCFSWLMPGKH